ncbi:hypothetical protein [Vibrio barjaei]|uniref:hypothetical protein n=1 Tax=Vibrio barjaei TaxID=1676683 RepID=UPI00228539CA|nr:hypothetical protein [Vibrio barjaei]MCY9872986.1 hypothetical protein [Vibrio barjaei]
MQLTKTILAASLVAALAGCSVTAQLDIKEDIQNTKHVIEDKREDDRYKKVMTLERPPLQLNEIMESNVPEYMSEQIETNVSGLPVSLVLRDILGDTKITWGHGVDPGKEISIIFEGSVEELVSLLEVTTNYGIEVTKEKVHVTVNKVKTFPIPVIPGDMSFQIGSSAAGGSSAASGALTGASVATGAGDGQYSSIGASGMNALDHIKAGVEAIIASTGAESGNGGSSAGNVTAIGMTSTLVVKAPPRIMKEVESFIEESVEMLAQEVVLEVEVIEYIGDDSTEIGAQLSGLMEEGALNFGVNTIAPRVGNAVIQEGLSVAARGNGALGGSSALINYLSKSGNVAVQTRQEVKASNFQIAEVDLSEVEEYISKTTVTYESDNASQPSVSIDKSVVRDGVKMLLIPTIHDDSVYLKLTGILSKFLGFEVVDLSGVQLKNPTVRQARFNTSGRYEYNRSIIVTHMRQEVVMDNKNSMAEVTTGVSGSREIVDTLVVVTPRRVMRAQ